MLPRVSLREITREDVNRIAEWLEDEEIADYWFGYAGKDPLHRGYDPILMQMASESEWNRVFQDDTALLIFSIYNNDELHIGECQVILDGKGTAEPSILIGRKDLWHRGYGTAAMMSLMDRLFDHHGVERIRVSVSGDNIPALGLFRKLGFVDEDAFGHFHKMVCEKSALKEVDILAGLTHAQVGRVISLARELEAPAGEVLGRAGEPGHQLYVILHGQVELSASSAVGDITMRIAGPGESFPLASLIGSHRLITSAIAMTDVKLLAIPSNEMLSLCSEDTAIGMRIYATIADVLGTRYSRTLAHLTHSAERVLKDADFFANV
jgi:RimJ/RimL family protein N-acetyltransferase